MFCSNPMISNSYLLSVVVGLKKKKKGKTIENYDFCSCEAYFEMSVYDPFEKNELYIDLWINMGSLTDGTVHGYDKGFRFTVTLDSMKMPHKLWLRVHRVLPTLPEIKKKLAELEKKVNALIGDRGQS
ncbi:MAG: hypothetical protein GY749_46470, partial [Desulfobacteraceae bacterium]|nr:hypothetical protein [Desulfobacteraceae bacterium]